MANIRTYKIIFTTFKILFFVISPVLSHEIAPSQLKEGEPLIVDAPSGLNLRPAPNSGILGVIPDESTIFATGAAELHQTGQMGRRYWAPVKFQAESGDWINGWVLLSHVRSSERSFDYPADSASQIEDRIVFTDADDSDGVEKAVTQEPAPAEAVMEDPQEAILTVRVNSVARLRAGPGTRHNILSRLENGTRLKILGRPQGHWIPVSLESGSEKGWVHASLLTAQGSFNPYEIAVNHRRSSDEARAEISDFVDSQETEAGFIETCDGSPSCLGSQTISDINIGDDESVVSGNDYVRPVSGGRISSNFGRRRDPITGQQGRRHGGMDFAVPVGTSVRSSRAGTVVQVVAGCEVGNRRCGGGWGNHVIVDHGNGIRTVYAHLSSVSVAVGDSVNQSEVIAESGNTGRTSGPNMHFEVHNNGVKQNPRNYLGI